MCARLCAHRQTLSSCSSQGSLSVWGEVAGGLVCVRSLLESWGRVSRPELFRFSERQPRGWTAVSTGERWRTWREPHPGNSRALVQNVRMHPFVARGPWFLSASDTFTESSGYTSNRHFGFIPNYSSSKSENIYLKISIESFKCSIPIGHLG